MEGGAEAEDYAVGGEDGDAGGFHVDEGHHHGGFGEGRGQGVGVRFVCAVGGRFIVPAGRRKAEGGSPFVHVGDGGLVAVVAIGDDELLVLHGGGDEIDEVGVGEAPDAVEDFVLVGDFEVGGGGRSSVAVGTVEDETLGGEGGVGVEHVDLLAVSAGGFEEGEAVGFVLGEGLFVAVDDLFGVVVEVTEGDEAAAFLRGMRAGDDVGLGVAVEGGLRLLAEDAFFCARRRGDSAARV